MIADGSFGPAEGMRDDFIETDEYDAEIFKKVELLRNRENWAAINRFMSREYGHAWMNRDEILSRKIAASLGSIAGKDREVAIACASAGEWAQAAIFLLIAARRLQLPVDPQLVAEAIDTWGELEMGAHVDHFAATWLNPSSNEQ